MKFKIFGRYLTILLINLLLSGYIFGLNENDLDPEYSIYIDQEEKSEELEINNDDEKELNLETYIKVNVDSNSADKIILDLDVKDIPFDFYYYLSNNLNEIKKGSVERIHAGSNHGEIRISDLEDLDEFYIQIFIKEKEVCEDVQDKKIKTVDCKYHNNSSISDDIENQIFIDNQNYNDIKNLFDISDNEENTCFFFEQCISSKNCYEPIEKCVENMEEEAYKMCEEGIKKVRIYNVKEECTRLKRNYILYYHAEKYDYYRIKDNDIFSNKKYSTFVYENNIGIIKNNKKIILTALGSGLNNFNFEYSIVTSLESSEVKEGPFIIKKNFFNGCAFIIDFNKFNNIEENVFIKFQLSSIENNEIITIKTRKYLDAVTINDLNNHFDIKLEEKEIETECFKFDESINNEEQYVINFLSLTKNIDFTIYTDNTNEIITELPINEESMIHLINKQDSNVFCFTINNNNNVYDFGSLSFDVSKINIETKQFYIIRGLSIHQYLESDTAAFYRPKNYINSEDINIKIKFHMTKGNSKLYLTECTEENCPVSGTINELTHYPDINGFISIKKTIPNENWVALVQCIDMECEFDIEIKEETEKTYLYQNLRLFSFIENDNEKFIINTKELSNQDILININSFNKEPNVLISFNDNKNEEFKHEEDYFMENKLVYKITQDDIKNKEYLYVEVNGDTNYYYGIFYEINNPNHRDLENGVLYYKELDDTTFNFINKNKECKTSNILNVNTFGNDLKLIYNSEEFTSDNNLINLEINNCNSFQINAINRESNDFTGNPLFNMGYNENSNHNKILIEHGYMYMNRLNTKNNEAVYSLILFKDQDDKNNLYVINFRKYSDITVTLTYNGNEKTLNELSKMIVLEENKINNCYGNNDNLYEYCELIIKIATNQELNNDEEIDFSIQVIKYEENPRLIYLPQNTFMSNMLISGFTQKYYTYINTNEEEKIYIDFLEGEGTASAKIENVDNNGYSDDISFDFYNKYFNINKEYTSNCGEKGCIIYIYVNLDKVSESKYKYNIYSKKKTGKAYFNVPETEYIFGHLENDDDVDYYTTKIQSNSVVLHINCDDCILTIENTKKSEKISMNQEYQAYLTDDQKKILKYSIKKNNMVSNQRYYIKVISYTEKLYIPVNSIRNEFCNIKSNSPCYFLIQKEHYNKVKTLRFLVTNYEDINIEVKKTATNDSNTLSVNEDIKKDKYILNNENICEKTNYCEDGIETYKDKEIIYKITVSLKHDDFITFISDQYEVNSELKNYIYKEDYMIISLDTEKKSKEISLLKPVGILHYDINLIKGKGYINQLKEGGESYYLESGFKENLNLLFKNSESESSIEVHANDNNNFIFYFRIIVNSNDENNLAELNFQRSNYFKYLNNNEDSNNWPLHFYMRINTNNLNNLNDINFNYKFSLNYKDKKDSNNTYEYFEEIYNSTVYLVDQDFIINKKFNNIENLNDPLNIGNNYRRDFTSGYSLITVDSISNKIDSNNNYLYIIIEKQLDKIEISNDVISVVLTLFDFNQNYFLPMNEYLLMEINEERTINIRKNLKTDNNYYPFIELSLNNTNYKITPDAEESPKYGKTFLNIKESQSYKMNIEKNEENPYFFMKHGLSYYNDFSYFLINEEIEKEKDIIIKFSPVEEHPDNIIQNNILSYIIYNIKIYNLSQISQDILENNEPYQLIKMINIEEDKSYNISKFIDYGKYSLSILAEARKGDIYEYLSYKPIIIEYIAEETFENIIINYEGGYYIPKFSKDIKFTANIEPNEDNKDIIKLTLRHNNYLEEDNYIFVSENKELLNIEKDKLYENSKYRLFKRETSLIIPIKELNERKLYIRIPCKNVCNYVFNYTLYTKDNISIYNNECFDMNLDNDDQSYTFQYNIKEENKFSLITLTSYSLLDKFKVTTGENIELKDSFFNGYSSYVKHNDYLTPNNKIVNFTINHNNLKLKICHKFSKDEKNEDYTKEIFNGDIKYTILKTNEQECYQIYNDTYEDINKITNYRISFISKSKNLEVNMYPTEGLTNNDDDYKIYEESKTIIIPKDYNKFCISNKDTYEGSALFQLLSEYENSYYNQSMNMPLIEGVSTKQKLQKGEILFYKLNEYISNTINIHFQTLSGLPKLYYYELEEETKDLNFSKETIETLGLKDFEGINNNKYYNKKIDDNKIPITIVHCDSDTCEFYIEMSYDKQTILLNNNRRIYSFYKKNGQNNQDEQDLNKYKIDLPLNDLKSVKGKKIYIQLYSLTGDLELNIQQYSLSDNENKYHNYNNNTRLFITELEKSSKFNIEISGNKNSYYNIFYYIIDLNKEDNTIYLPSGEVHYNILPQSNMQYYFQDDSIKESLKYMVTLNSINCDLKVNGENNEQSSKYFQFFINSDEKIKISSQMEEDLEDKCEFTISAVQLKDDGSLKDLIFNERTYQYYNYNSNKFNNINIKYFISNLNEKSDKHVTININKKSDKNLILKYTINDKEFENIIYNYNDMIKINVEDLKEIEKKKGNLYELNIMVEPENNDIEFKIKITEDKELYSYLDYEDIEYGIIEKGKLHNYYYEYFGNNNDVNEEIYLDCKGMAKIDNILIKYNENNYLDLKENNNIYTNNYISMKGNEFINCKKGCKIYFSINLPVDNNNNTESNDYNIYIISSNKKLNVFENINIYGYLDSNVKFLFKTPINNINSGEIPFNINCMKCTVTIYNENDSKDFSFYNSIILDNSSKKRKELIYSIETQNSEKCYFYFSVIDPKNPKYIYQKESIISKPNYRFILPLYTYFSYNKDNVLLYVPDNEKVIIYEKIIEKNNLNYTYLNNFNLLEDSDINSQNLLITNRLFVDITNYYSKDSYMLIQIESDYDYNFTFIVSEFYKSLDDNNEIFPHNIFTLKNEFKQLINNSYENYKIKMHLINGSGLISLSENEDEVYELNYENQEIIHCLNNNGYLKANSSKNEENFIFYLEVKKKDFKYDYNLVIQKANHLKIFNKESINLKFENIKKKDLFINIHFLKLESKQTTSDAIKIEENFQFSLFGINIQDGRSQINMNNKKETNTISNPFRRGYIHIKSNDIKEDSKYILLYISNLTYSKVYLEVTPLYINKDDEKLLELPRNAYLELEADYLDNIYFSKPNEEYNNVKIELGYINNYDIDLTSLSLNNTNYIKNKIGGKYYYNINDESLKYKIKLNDTKGNILLKYTTKKDNYGFSLENDGIQCTLIDEDKGLFKINYDNIKNNNNSINNYKVSYMIALYDWLEFYDYKEIVNILVNVTDNITLRKELTDDEKLLDKLEYNIEFGNLSYAEFCICIIGEIYYNDNIEYFTYDFDTYIKKKPKKIEFDEYWIYPLVIIVLIFLVVVLFLIRALIKRRNETNNETGKFLLNKVKDNNNIEIS